jgi:hypothetical protein
MVKLFRSRSSAVRQLPISHILLRLRLANNTAEKRTEKRQENPKIQLFKETGSGEMAATPPPSPSLAPEIGPDGLARDSPVLAYTEKVSGHKPLPSLPNQ